MFIRFSEYFKKVLEENITTTDAGISGDGTGFSPNNSTSSDSYAPGDARLPVSIFGKGKVLQRINKKKKNKQVKKQGVNGVFLTGEEGEESKMCPDACCGLPVEDCTCPEDCPNCNCYELNKLTEAKEAPKGKHYTSRGALKSGDADADGDGGPKYRSDPTYNNPNDPSDEELEDTDDTVEVTLPIELAEILHELLMGVLYAEEDAEYQGRKVTLNKPTRGDVKKFKVYVKDPKTGNVKKVNFGHGGTSAKRKTMRIRKSNPKARKSFRARHKCDQKKSKLTAGYWSCKKW